LASHRPRIRSGGKVFGFDRKRCPRWYRHDNTQETRAVNKKSEPIKPKIAGCIALAGSVPAGVLLYRISFWSNGKGIERDGHKWVTLSNARWMFETGLTPKQLRSAFEQLADKGSSCASTTRWNTVRSYA
jgi:hypothetical protein